MECVECISQLTLRRASYLHTVFGIDWRSKEGGIPQRIYSGERERDRLTIFVRESVQESHGPVFQISL